MATSLRLRRGTATEHETFTGAAGELTYVTDTHQLRMHDGATAGGFATTITVVEVNSAGEIPDPPPVGVFYYIKVP